MKYTARALIAHGPGHRRSTACRITFSARSLREARDKVAMGVVVGMTYDSVRPVREKKA